MKRYKITKKKMVAAGATVIVLAGSITIPVFAATRGHFSSSGNNKFGNPGEKPAVFGTVSGVTGSTITLSAKNATSTVYTVDAANAKIIKNENGSTTPITIGDIQSGDTLFVEGTTTGLEVTASVVVDGTFPARREEKNGNRPAKTFVKRDHVMGQISGVYGGSFTVTTHNHIKHSSTTPAVASTTEVTIDTSGSTVFKKGGVADTSSDLAIGQYVLVTGINDTAASVFNATSVNILTATPGSASTTPHRMMPRVRMMK